MTLYKNRYRIESTRLQGWDYSSHGYYFITICTKNRIWYFGNITGKKMILSNYGKITQKYWQEIPDHFENISLDEFVIMPNHIHGILIINRKPTNDVETPKLGVSTGPIHKWKPGTIGVVINQYKRICTINIRKFNPEFAWQPRFHDHIIQNDNELNRIRRYIVHNPENWNGDNNY